MALRSTADQAEDVAAGFRQFREPLPEHTAEITSLIADLYGISASLKSLEIMIRSRRYCDNYRLVKADLELLRASLNYTLDDIIEAFSKLDRKNNVNRVPYKRTWNELSSFFEEESSGSLSIRLQKYKMFLKEIENIMQNKTPDLPQMARLRTSLSTILTRQDSRLATQLNAISLGRAESPDSLTVEASSLRAPRQRRSYERPRPYPRPHNSRASSPSVAFSPNSYDIPPPPYVPDVPDSPTSNSVTTYSSGSANLNSHWARKVFPDDLPATRIPPSTEISECFGDNHPGVKEWLFEQGYEEVLSLPFNSRSDLHIRFFVRESDNRARIVCRVRHSTRRTEYFCLPLNMLEIVREESCLRLCRKRRSGTELVLWTSLKFHTIERMVIFFCTFLALRSQDSGRPVDNTRDYELDDEEELFGGQIIDDNYLHALRVYKDSASGAVRLQASVHKGEMKRSPVWTAFITHHINSPAWILNVEPKVVHLRELRRTIFSSEYNPMRTRQGEHILKFTTRSDAESFRDTIEELSTG